MLGGDRRRLNRRPTLIGLCRALGRVLAAGLALSLLTSCFASREPLITVRESARLFGTEGYAKRVSFDRMGGGPLADLVTYRWTGDGYEIVSLANPRDRVTYRVAALDRVWLVAQVIEGGRATYGIGKLEGPRVWTYAPECRGLTDADRAELKIDYLDSQTCLVGDRAQLRAALQRTLQRGARPQGYYEVVPPPVVVPARPAQGPPR